MRSFFMLLTVLLAVFSTSVQAQDSDTPLDDTADVIQATRLDELANLLQRKELQRDELKQKSAQSQDKASTKERETLEKINRDIDKLKSTFELIALEDTNTSLFSESESLPTDWQQDLLEILKPLIDSLKSVTERPRQIAELRDTVFNTEAKLVVTQQALDSIESISTAALTSDAATRITDLQAKWRDEQEQIVQERLIANSQLDRLTNDQQSFFQGVWPATRTFLLGRGLTLLVAIGSAIAVWALMRILWWVYKKHFTTKTQRRNSTWFRLLSYSYYLLTSMVVTCIVLIALYIREDLLLLALAFLLIAGVALSFRQFLPHYVREARLLLNLGAVREDERVFYNGLPWQVVSLNLTSVLRNPALDGVIRLPLEIVSTLVSRPVKNNLWFPSNEGDYVILPSGLLGKIKHQTPDLVEISVRGGMSMTYTTSEFYSINLINLSHDETFGVSVTFGFDYSLQSISLTDIPNKISEAIRQAFKKSGFENQLENLLVELSVASSSSLDYIIFATMQKSVAKDFYKLERLIQQTCIAVSNEQQWTIPFPQLTVHSSSNTK